MRDQAYIDQLVTDIRHIYMLDSDQAQKHIEQFLKKRLENLTESQRLSVLKKMIAQLDSTFIDRTDNFILDDGVIPRIYSLLLG